jgi:hypothetical protein
MNTIRILSLIIGVVLLVIALVFCFRGSDKDDFIRMVKMMPEDLSGLTFIDVHTLQADDGLASTWDWVRYQFIGEDIYGENVSKLTGFGITVGEDSLRIYKGDFDFTQMTSIIEQSSLESFEYEGITVWADQNASSIAVIDKVLFVGSSENIQLCVDVANGQGTSLYDNKDAKDTIGRLPGGYVLGVALMGSENSSVDNYGVLASGMAASKNDGNISQTWLYKFQDSDAAQGYITEFGSQIPSDYDVTQDGEYVTIAVTSEQPDPNEEAYNSAYSDLQNAVVAYATDNNGVFPTINGTANISGYDLQIIDICSLLTSEGGMLNEVPEGVAIINGSDNDNCDAGCDGCLDTNHYLWAIDEYGYVYSTCVGTNCSEYNTDGYQGVWP